MAQVFALEQGLIEAGRHANATQYQGKLRFLKASFTTSATPGALGSGVITVNNGDVVIFGLLLKDMIVFDGLVTFGAMAGGATGSIGTYSRVGNTFTAVAATRYLNALVLTAAGQNAIAATDAQNFMDVLTADSYIGLVAGVANYANGQTFKMKLPYSGD